MLEWTIFGVLLTLLVLLAVCASLRMGRWMLLLLMDLEDAPPTRGSRKVEKGMFRCTAAVLWVDVGLLLLGLAVGLFYGVRYALLISLSFLIVHALFVLWIRAANAFSRKSKKAPEQSAIPIGQAEAPADGDITLEV